MHKNKNFQKWRNDGHGISFTPKNVKIYANGKHTWAMKISGPALRNGKTPIRLATYSMPDLEYCYNRFKQAPHRFYVVCHEKFIDKALSLKNALPEMQLYIHPKIHSKICLIAPATIYVGSANFGVSKWIESNIGIRSEIGHDWLIKNFWIPTIEESQKVELYMDKYRAQS